MSEPRWSPFVLHLVSSGFGAGVAELATLPICTIKTNYQKEDQASIRQVIRNLYRDHGVKGFYRASGWALSSQILSTTSKYTLYQKTKEYVPNLFLAGVTSGILASTMTHPFDVIKFHSQTHTSFREEFRKVGLPLFYRGFSKTVTKTGVSSIFFLPLYDTFLDKPNRLQDPNLSVVARSVLSMTANNPVAASLVTSILSTSMMQPFDYMKVRQALGLPFFSGFYPRPYFKGLSLNLARVVPHFVIMMTLIDGVQKRMQH